MNSTLDRRTFWRAPFNTRVLLIDTAGVWPAKLKDISLQGALLEISKTWHGEYGTNCQIKLELTPDAIITMQGSIAHLQGVLLGFRCEEIDLDSISHLRRLVELNAGDPTILEREFNALLHPVQAAHPATPTAS